MNGNVATDAGEILDLAVQCAIEACGTQFELPLGVAGEPRRPDVGLAHCGGAISFIDDNTGFNLLLMGNRAYGHEVTRAMFMLEPDEEVAEDDMADAIGEFVNIVAGMLKRKLADREYAVRIGLPMFVRGSGCIEYFAEGVLGAAITLEGGSGMRMQPVIIWKGNCNDTVFTE